MKHFYFVLALLGALSLQANAQEAAPTPDPHVYDDPAMHYVAPPDARAVASKHVALADLSQDPTMIAAWVIGNSQANGKVISIVMESYDGNLDGFDSTYENGLRGDDAATLVKQKERVLLRNGMPALFLDVTQGAGFDTRKIYAYIWIDSQRAVILSVTSALGAVDEQTARAIMASATAVRYPSGGP